MKFTNWNVCMLGMAVVAAGGWTPAMAADPSVLFMADAQIHNVYGGEVKETLGVADWFSGVAQRHPEMDLLSRYALQDFIERGEKQAEPGAPPFMVMLGDATNAACTGEYERFMKAAKSGNPGRIVLMAHGNHDSYLMGTINYWQAPLDGIDLTAFKETAFPVDATWWPDFKPKAGAHAHGWMALCRQSDAHASTPMNKIQWMAKYLASLAQPTAGGPAQLEFTPGTVGKEKSTFSAVGKPGTALGDAHYSVEGEWIRPTADRHGLADTYDSFLVQAVDVGSGYRLILVDTAACAWYQRGWWAKLVPRFGEQNAGLTACMREPQRQVIEKFAREAQAHGRKIVFAGHHPLKNFLHADRAPFERIMADASNGPWTYISAHTHDPYTDQDRGNGARELNISSTTDWPMTAFRITFGERVDHIPVPGPDATFAYQPPDFYPNGSELCRHYDAALKLKNLDLNDTSYASPGTVKLYKDCNREVATKWSEYESKLTEAETEIERRMAEPDGRYRIRALSIMAAASQHERKTPSLDKVKIQ